MKPRKFWIKGATAHEFEVVNSISVIEKSAYDKAVEALKRINKQREVLGSKFMPYDLAAIALKELGEL